VVRAHNQQAVLAVILCGGLVAGGHVGSWCWAVFHTSVAMLGLERTVGLFL
jgi:hypothetical protein